MKVLGIAIGCIVFFCLGFIIFAQVRNANELQKKQNDKQVREETQKTIVSADDKINKAEQLLSKNSTSLKDQEEARRLIDESIGEAKKATEMAPDNPQVWFYLSEVYLKLTKVNPKAVNLSIDALNHAIYLDQNNGTFYNKRATMYMTQENYKEAEKDLLKAINLEPQKANHYYKLANTYKETGRKEDARKLYLQAKALTSPDNQMALAQIDVMMKELEKNSKVATPTASIRK